MLLSPSPHSQLLTRWPWLLLCLWQEQTIPGIVVHAPSLLAVSPCCFLLPVPTLPVTCLRPAASCLPHCSRGSCWRGAGCQCSLALLLPLSVSSSESGLSQDNQLPVTARSFCHGKHNCQHCRDGAVCLDFPLSRFPSPLGAFCCFRSSLLLVGRSVPPVSRFSYHQDGLLHLGHHCRAVVSPSASLASAVRCRGGGGEEEQPELCQLMDATEGVYCCFFKPLESFSLFQKQQDFFEGFTVVLGLWVSPCILYL